MPQHPNLLADKPQTHDRTSSELSINTGQHVSSETITILLQQADRATYYTLDDASVHTMLAEPRSNLSINLTKKILHWIRIHRCPMAPYSLGRVVRHKDLVQRVPPHTILKLEARRKFIQLFLRLPRKIIRPLRYEVLRNEDTPCQPIVASCPKELQIQMKGKGTERTFPHAARGPTSVGTSSGTCPRCWLR